jgi:hypothetical protein
MEGEFDFSAVIMNRKDAKAQGTLAKFSLSRPKK